MQESEDFYVGQTLESSDGRTSRHDTLSKKDIAEIRRWYPKAMGRVRTLPKRVIGVDDGGPFSLPHRCRRQIQRTVPKCDITILRLVTTVGYYSKNQRWT